MAVVIAAPASGSGKTLLSLLLLAWARACGHSIQPFKVGPDYLDPQLLSATAGRSCRNLDLNLCGDGWVQRAFHGYAKGADLALVEGVMGLFDGIGCSQEGSTAAVAHKLGLPVVLVVDAGGQAASLAAVVKGFRDHDPRLQIAGVVLNRVSTDRHRELLSAVLDSIDMPLLGCLPRHDALDLPSRHLGLAPAHELQQQALRQQHWVDLAQQHLDLERGRPLLTAPAAGEDPLAAIAPPPGSELPVAVASDAAFHFRYTETEELLQHLGMPVLPWSPLADEPLPQNARGLIIPGGFPEQHAAQLSSCRRSLHQLATWAEQRPIYAECGGMLLLGESLTDLEGRQHAMAGLLPFQARRGQLQVGYRQLTPQQDGLLVRCGEPLRGHEFHRWMLQNRRGPRVPTALWEIEGWRRDREPEGWGTRMIHASWVHLHWASSSTICSRWRAALEAAPTPSPDGSSHGHNPAGFNPSLNAGA